MSTTTTTSPPKRGIVKQVLSGDSVIIRGQPKGGPPPEKSCNFANVIAPKLARRPGAGGEETRDEPWAWEAREFLRKKLVGEEVCFISDKPNINASREYGVVFLGKDPSSGENITELMVSEGLVSVRREGVRPSPELTRLTELEDAAKSAGKGKWGSSPPSEHVREITWSMENTHYYLDQRGGQPVQAVIEHVRDGSTVRAFLMHDNTHTYVTLMISGIRCPGFKLDDEGKPNQSVVIPFAEEARYFVESRLLHRDVEILLESVNNKNFVGTILFPKGNIAEALLREGFANCVDWSMAFMKSGVDKLRAAERHAKENRLRIWQNYQSKAPLFTGKEKDFNGTVTEVFQGDAINVKSPAGVVKKVFLSSIRPPRESNRSPDEEGKMPPRPKNFRPLYDIPWMFETREFLRKKLVGKKVHCNLDYISPARDTYPEKYCYTVTVGGVNVAEALVSKGFASVVKHRQDDDHRSSHYDDLMAAENQAIKGLKGIYAKKDIPIHRINDLTADHSRIKHQYLPSWQRALRTEAVVEFVASGSRFRMYVPKESCLVTFLLAGITCPRTPRPASNGMPGKDGEPFGEEALNYSKERVLQRDVTVHIDTTDKAATSVIGWLWTDNNVNLSVALVEEGLASVHFSAEKSEHYRVLKAAEDKAKAIRKNIWANYVEEVPEEKVDDNDDEKDDKVVERKVNYEKVVVTEVTSELHFYAQHTDQGAKLEALMQKLRQDFKLSPPLTGSYNPKRGELCAAKFSEDNDWYRAKVERIQGGKASIIYVDYGNRETVPTTCLAILPSNFSSDRPYASEYVLAFSTLPPDDEDKLEACKAFGEDVLNKNLLLNVEYRSTLPHATLSDPATNVDLGKRLVSEGFLLVEKRRERKLANILNDYKEAEQSAKKSHTGIWKYGDVTEDNEDQEVRLPVDKKIAK